MRGVRRGSIFGSNLRIARKSLGLTQKELASGIGVVSSHISDIEIGKSNPSEKVIEAIVTTYKINRSFLLGDNGDIFEAKND